MKRYLVYAYERYYPSGGWRDLIGDRDTLEEANELLKRYLDGHFAGGHIVDTETWQIVDSEESED